MIQLDKPNYNSDDSIEKVTVGITGDTPLRQAVRSEQNIFSAWEQQYLDRIDNGSLFEFEANTHVFQAVTHDNIAKLYPNYFSKKNKPARDIYDAIKNAAAGKCPFCGGIGFPKNLDHYLPKRSFSQFSILPLNLVPACRDCNMGAKGQSFAINAEKQALHPYEDAQHFFDEQWVFAEYIPSDNDDEVGEFRFYAKPPEAWNAIDTARAKFHFEAFELAEKFATKAAEELPIALTQFKRLRLKGIDERTIKESIFSIPIESFIFVNHWRRCMYQALYTHDF
ncbi:HNH endonuclease [Aliidiomarina soli]|uniref:Endonuclease n=1 Tax=Aliidiomarina soli TaxID=1928574 RepID=A0A432WF62_9GAMM|nr:HNH endonuclease signature motif containing protein [Aliidiomarina soli]RUO32423.1 endonuclease [Aliidiomarina soli]